MSRPLTIAAAASTLATASPGPRQQHQGQVLASSLCLVIGMASTGQAVEG